MDVKVESLFRMHQQNIEWPREGVLLQTCSRTRIKSGQRKSPGSTLGGMKKYLPISVVLLWGSGCSKDVVRVHDGAVEDREVVLILPGLGYDNAGIRHMEDFADTLYAEEFDVVVPNYLARRGLDRAIDNVNLTLDDYALRDYAGLHVFAYIAGTWAINTIMQEEELENLSSIVYDRSPLQERAPTLATTQIPVLAKLLFGSVIFDIADTPFPEVDLPDASVGIMIENVATAFILRNKEAALDMSPLSFEVEDLDQDYDDVVHLPLNHDDMYRSFDIVGPELIHFFQTGLFTDEAEREPLGGDPFE